MDWIINNKEWLFSGLGLTVITMLFAWPWKKKEAGASQGNSTNNIEINVAGGTKEEKAISSIHAEKTLEDYKNETRILFIDDDARFKVAKILAQSGWVHTKLIKDCKSLDSSDITEAQLLFIDVQGVGVSLGFSDEGLGLALAIKAKYPTKKVVIYSAENKGDRFHDALRKADSFLSKDADPYEFQAIVEELTIGITS